MHGFATVFVVTEGKFKYSSSLMQRVFHYLQFGVMWCLLMIEVSGALAACGAST